MKLIITPHANITCKIHSIKGQIISIDDFLLSKFYEKSTSVLLNKEQEIYLWFSLLDDIDIATSYLQTYYQEKTYLIESYLTLDERYSHYQKIKDKFLAKKKDSLVKAELIDFIKDNLSGDLPEIIFANFSNISPALNSLIKTLQQKTKVSFYHSNNNENQEFHIYENIYDEYENMFNWAKDKAGKTALVLPNFNGNKKLAKIYSEKCKLHVKISNFSTLDDFSCIKILFVILKEVLEKEDLNLILNSNFISLDTNTKDNLKKINEEGISYIKVLNSIETLKTKPSLFAKITIEDFILHVKSIVKHFNWMGNQQHHKDLEGVVDCFWATLHKLEAIQSHEKHSYVTLYRLFLNITSMQKYSSVNESNIEIVGIKQACGGEYDNIWISGFCSDNLPANIQINPVIPKDIQIKYEIEGFFETDVKILEKEVATFLSSAKNICFSYPKNIHGINTIALPFFKDKFSQQKPTLKKETILDTIEDEPLKFQTLPGGTYGLKWANKCLFSAFAKYRLKAPSFMKNLSVPAYIKGQVIHNTLWNFYRQIKSKQKLLDLDQKQIKEIIALSFNQAKSLYEHYSLALNKIEEERIENIINQFIELEKQRDFFTIKSLEKSMSLDILNTQISIRIDRIDTTTHGDYLIDYKTNINKDDEIQLLIYLLANEKATKASLIKLKPNQVLVKGFSKNSDSVLDVIDDFESFKQNAKEKIESIAIKYMTKQTITPGSYCINCGLKSLCRAYDV